MWPPTLIALCDEYNHFLAEHGLPHMSADELILEDNITKEQKEWLRNFIDRWEKADK